MADPEYNKLFDHEYDGIREYDNPLPGWWVWLFAITVILCVPYVMWYHIGIGASVHDRLDAEIAAYAAQLMATYGELEADEGTILHYASDDVAMTGMAGLFKGKCAQCHLADGSGNIGPNLTDNHYKNVKTVTDIPKILREGVAGKGMPAWEGKLTDTEMVLLSSYVVRLRRNPLPGKAPEGTELPPWPVAAPVEPAAEPADT